MTSLVRRVTCARAANGAALRVGTAGAGVRERRARAGGNAAALTGGGGAGPVLALR